MNKWEFGWVPEINSGVQLFYQCKGFLGSLNIYPNQTNNNIPTIAALKVFVEAKASFAGAVVAVSMSISHVNTSVLTAGHTICTFIPIWLYSESPNNGHV